jgi:ketosteroid isomerase-like protein
VFARLPEDFDGFRIDVRRMVGCGDTVLVESRYGGTARATGKPLDAQVAHVWDLREGKVVHWQQYTDTWHFAEVTGTVPGLARA